MHEKKQQDFWNAIGISLLVHSLLALILSLQQSRIENPEPVKLLSVSLNSRPALASPASPNQHRKKEEQTSSSPVQSQRINSQKKLQSNRTNRLHLKNLGISPFQESAHEPSTGSGARKGKKDGYDLANAMGIVEEGADLQFFRSLWNQINSKLQYPDTFIKQRIEGKVVVQISVNKKGMFSDQFLESHSNSPYLEAYVVALLIHALSEPLKEKNWLQHAEEIILVSEFSFNVFSNGHLQVESEKLRHFKNSFYFKREAYALPKFNEKIEKFFTRYFPPIIPVPGGFFIDFVRAYQMIKYYHSERNKMDYDERTKVLLQFQKEKWNQVIKKSSPSQ